MQRHWEEAAKRINCRHYAWNLDKRNPIIVQCSYARAALHADAYMRGGPDLWPARTSCLIKRHERSVFWAAKASLDRVMKT